MSRDRTRWIRGRATYLFPVKALSRVFRAKYLDALRRPYNPHSTRPGSHAVQFNEVYPPGPALGLVPASSAGRIKPYSLDGEPKGHGGNSVGGPELVVVLAIAVPIVAVVWLGRVMKRVQKSQEEMKHQLDIIERALQRERSR